MSMHWVVVADEGKARIFAADDLLGELEELAGLVHPASRLPEHDRVSDRQGRFALGDGRRTSAEPRTDHETVEARRFAKLVVEALRAGQREEAFERLVLVAAPRFLGVLRAALDEHLAAVVVAEIAKDLTGMSVPRIVEALHRLMPPTAGAPL